MARGAVGSARFDPAKPKPIAAAIRLRLNTEVNFGEVDSSQWKTIEPQHLYQGTA
jgi:hypothetical protein